MEIVTYCYIIFNIAVILPYLNAKPIIQHGVIVRDNKPPPINQKNLFLPGNLVQNKKLSGPKYKKTFQIKSPLKAKKVKFSQRSRNKRKNQTTKKDYYHYDAINQNYIPILKNLGLLFNNILGSDTSDITDSDNSPYKSENDDVICECAHKRNADSEASNSQKKAVTVIRSFSTNTTTASATATTPTNHFTDDNIGYFRRNKNISLLLSRNTTGFRRNDYRFGQGSSPTYNGSIERNFPRTLRNDERDTRSRELKSYTKNDTKDTNGYTRDHASSNRSNDEIRRLRKRLRNFSRGTTTEKSTLEANKTSGGFKRNLFKYKGKNEFETARNKTKTPELLSKSAPGLRRFKLHEKAKSYETTEVNEEKITEITLNATSNKRLADRNGQTTTENQEIRTRNEELKIESTLSDNFTSKTNKTSDNENAIKMQETRSDKVTESYKNNESREEIIKISFNTTKIKPLSDHIKGESHKVLFTATTSPPMEKFIVVYDAKKVKQDFKLTRNKTKIAELKLPDALENHSDEMWSHKSYEGSEEKSFKITFNSTNIKQLSDHESQSTTLNKETRSYNDALTTSMTISTPIEKFVMIYDGYSVARDGNGKNI